MSGILQIVIGGLLQGGVFAIVALGFSLVYRVTNVVNLSQGAFCVLGAMGMYYFQVVFGWPALPAAVAAVVASTAFGVLVGALTFVPAVTRIPTSSVLVLTAGLLNLSRRRDARGVGQSALRPAAFLGRGSFRRRRIANSHPGCVACCGVGGHDRRIMVAAAHHLTWSGFAGVC